MNVFLYGFEDGDWIVQGNVICTDRGIVTTCYCACYEYGGRIVQGNLISTNRGTATARYCVCYEDVEKVVQYTVICIQTEEL
jgi:hypothetical protein